MYEKHPVFTPPPDENIKIWRYMDFTKFLSFIDKETLFFTRVDQLEDKFEGRFAKYLFNPEIEEKSIRREDKKWYLGFKGIIAVLLILKKPKKWNPEWKEVFDKRAKIIERDAAPFLEKYGIPKEDIHSGLKGIGLTLDDFDAWVGLSNTAKSLIENGMMDFDVIKESTLMGLLIMESMTPLELSEIWNENT